MPAFPPETVQQAQAAQNKVKEVVHLDPPEPEGAGLIHQSSAGKPDASDVGADALWENTRFGSTEANW